MKLLKITGLIWVAIGLFDLLTNISGLQKFLNYGEPFNSEAWGVFAPFIVAGLVAIVCGGILFFNKRGLRIICIITSSAYGFYYFTYLLFGGEGAILNRLVHPVLMLVFCYWTIKLVRGIKQSIPNQTDATP